MSKRDNFTVVADQVPFDNSTTDFTSDTVQGALEEISNIDIKALTEFEAFSSTGTQTTTSNRWVTKTDYPYTTVDVKTAGRYIIDFTAQLGQSDKEKQVGSRYQYREGTSGTWITLGSPILDALSTDDAFQYRTTFSEITLLTDTVFQVRIQFGQTDDGGTAFIREANIKIGKAA